MAWRPSEWVLEGELDNTILGWTTGWISIAGIEEPLQLKLVGNCHPDLAGWKFKIIRTAPPASATEPLQQLEDLAINQSGYVGDITADQVLKEFDCSVEEFVKQSRAGNPPPTKINKALYLEWFSNKNGRVVIQSTRLAVRRQGERAFELTEEQWAEQAKQNLEEINHFMLQLGDAIDPPPQEDSGENPDC